MRTFQLETWVELLRPYPGYMYTFDDPFHALLDDVPFADWGEEAIVVVLINDWELVVLVDDPGVSARHCRGGSADRRRSALDARGARPVVTRAPAEQDQCPYEMRQADMHKSAQEVLELLTAGGAPVEAISFAERRVMDLAPAVEFHVISRAYIVDLYTWRLANPRFDPASLPGSDVLIKRLSGSAGEMLLGAVMQGPGGRGALILWLNSNGDRLVAAVAASDHSGTEGLAP